MTNLLTKAYEAFDETMMYSANTALKAYNWTTGGNKTDLANGMLKVAPLVEGLGSYMKSLPYFAIAAPIFLGSSYMGVKLNKDTERREKIAEEAGMLDILKESNKNYNEKIGTAFAVWALIWGTFSAAENHVKLEAGEKLDYSNLIWAAGNGIRALSHYVMRCDDLPRGKSVLSKAKKSLEEIAAGYNLSKKLKTQTNKSKSL